MKPHALAIVAALGLGGAGLLAARPVQAASDASRGERVHARCLACHALAYDRVGPRHCGLLGRKAGTVPGFDYSTAMKRSGLTWDERTLRRFLAAPTKVVPGTTMTYDGVSDRQELADLIAYLRHADETRACRGGDGTRR
jgi:cytochrome c